MSGVGINHASFLWEASRALDASQAEKKSAAPHFSPFDSFIELSENKISDIVAWMLNPSGSHAQGADFLNSFLSVLGVSIPTGRATVRRESPTYAIPNSKRRLDILVDYPRFALAVEMKWHAKEQVAQVREYMQHLEKVRDGYVLVFLTVDGGPPLSVQPKELERFKTGKLIPMGYDALAGWIRQCADICSAPSLKPFLNSFRDFILHEHDPSMSLSTSPLQLRTVIAGSLENLRAAAEVKAAWRDTVIEIGKKFASSLEAALSPKWHVERECDFFEGEWGGLNVYGENWGHYRVRIESVWKAKSTWKEIVLGIHDPEGNAETHAEGALKVMKALDYHRAKVRPDYWPAGVILADGDAYWANPETLWLMQSGDPAFLADVAGRIDQLATAAEPFVKQTLSL